MRMINQIKLNYAFFILILFIQTRSVGNDNSEFGMLVSQIFQKLEPVCFADLNSTLDGEEKAKPEKEKKYSWLFDYMGKGFNDIGDECECRYAMKSNNTFLLLYFHHLNMTALLDVDKDLIDYLDIKNYTYGLCIMTSCADTVVKYFKILLEFVNYINTNEKTGDDIVSYIISNNDKLNYSYINTTIINVDQNKNDQTRIQKEIILWILIGLGLVKLIGGFIRVFTIPKGYDKYIAEMLNKNGKLNDGKIDLEEKSNFLSKNTFNEPVDS